ncbi:hypothetical protein Glove_58g42 [Diversispora epigaea]|uniref:Uncharacterized protein n=1 Tax=Diversispora epigaea TaxID=1348612 RepID=A0A397JN65_9GLOM|nr:hypothetical protein Glove_58g42 [Diversispora epigaea]
MSPKPIKTTFFTKTTCISFPSSLEGVPIAAELFFENRDKDIIATRMMMMMMMIIEEEKKAGAILENLEEIN